MALLIKNSVTVTPSLHFIAMQSLSSVGKADFCLALSILSLFCGVRCECVCLSLETAESIVPCCSGAYRCVRVDAGSYRGLGSDSVRTHALRFAVF